MTVLDSLQVLLDEEQEGMESAARFADLRDTDSFDYSSYHTLSEVSSLGDLEGLAGVFMGCWASLGDAPNGLLV